MFQSWLLQYMVQVSVKCSFRTLAFASKLRTKTLERAFHRWARIFGGCTIVLFFERVVASEVQLSLVYIICRVTRYYPHVSAATLMRRYRSAYFFVSMDRVYLTDVTNNFIPSCVWANKELNNTTKSKSPFETEESS